MSRRRRDDRKDVITAAFHDVAPEQSRIDTATLAVAAALREPTVAAAWKQAVDAVMCIILIGPLVVFQSHRLQREVVSMLQASDVTANSGDVRLVDVICDVIRLLYGPDAEYCQPDIFWPAHAISEKEPPPLDINEPVVSRLADLVANIFARSMADNVVSCDIETIRRRSRDAVEDATMRVRRRIEASMRETPRL